MNVDTEPIIELTKRPHIWSQVGIPSESVSVLIRDVARYSLLLKQMGQHDPIRMLQAATEHANAILDGSRSITEVRAILQELKDAEDAMSRTYKPLLPLVGAAQRKILSQQLDTLRARCSGYFAAHDIPVPAEECTYGYCLGLLHTMDTRIVGARCKMIATTLLELRSWCDSQMENGKAHLHSVES